MLELSCDNALDYLREQWLLNTQHAVVETLSGGVSNVVLRVVTPERTFVLKQSRPQLRTRDAWFSDPERVYREQDVMLVLQPLLPKDTVPEILFSDRRNFVFAMSHAPAGARVWKEMLLDGLVELALGERAGSILGRIHEATARNTTPVERFDERTVFVQLRVDPFYRRIQERRTEVANAVQPIIDGLLQRREALCHGDYSPKNLLAHALGFTLVDYETAHFGDPAMDLGFFLSHLLLKSIRAPALREPFHDLTRAFWRGYGWEVRFRSLAELQARGIQHCAVCMLARIDGTSPVDYLPEEPQREAVRRIGRRLLWERPSAWEEVLAIANAEIS
jgi:5-methylthioribose kinase